MITEVIMKRELFGMEISQKSKSELFSATDLVKAGNRWRALNSMPMFNISTWLQNESNKEFIAELEKKFGTVKINSKAKNQHTWVHPYLFIDIALAISPELKIEVYSWLFDHLIKYRNDSGDSYKRMSGALYCNSTNKTSFPRYIMEVASKIQKACMVENWQLATEKQLQLRDSIHRNIELLSDVLKDNDQAVKIAIIKAVQHG
jgi:hypothetical protein